MKRTLTAVAVAVAFAAPAQAHVASAHGSKTHQLQVRIAHDRGVIAAVDRQARTSGSAMFVEWNEWLTRQWHARDLASALSQLQAMLRPAHYSGWLCIHHYEGSWSDSGDPYWGGLQMDRGFMRTYGSDMIRRYGGYANVWPPNVQMQVAERAYSGYAGEKPRGYHPWPNTARYCGLL